jgi:hypothetical protein
VLVAMMSHFAAGYSVVRNRSDVVEGGGDGQKWDVVFGHFGTGGAKVYILTFFLLVCLYTRV